MVYAEDLMSRKIVITGATGFIGGALAHRLTSTDWRIRALVRSASYHKRPKDIAAEWVVGDLENMESLRRLTAGADVIVHCAGAVRGAVQMDFDRINVNGVGRLVQAAAEQKPIPRFLLISSLAAREPLLSHYASSKLKGEKVLTSYAGDMVYGVLRPSAIYGPGDREMLPLFQWMFRGIAPLIGSGANRVSLLHVEDLVEAIVCWLYDDKCRRSLYELHDGRRGGYSWGEIVEVVECLRDKSVFRAYVPISFLKIVALVNLGGARVFGGMPMLTPGKVRELIHPDWVADNTQLNRDTGWVPRISLKEGLRQIFASVL